MQAVREYIISHGQGVFIIQIRELHAVTGQQVYILVTGWQKKEVCLNIWRRSLQRSFLFTGDNWGTTLQHKMLQERVLIKPHSTATFKFNPQRKKDTQIPQKESTTSASKTWRPSKQGNTTAGAQLKAFQHWHVHSAGNLQVSTTAPQMDSTARRRPGSLIHVFINHYLFFVTIKPDGLSSWCNIYVPWEIWISKESGGCWSAHNNKSSFAELKKLSFISS